MKIQSLSILVPAPCPNKCPFCVSRMNTNKQLNLLPDKTIKEFLQRGGFSEDSYIRAWVDRLEYASKLDINSVMLTSTGEAMLNLDFIKFFAKINRRMLNPFRFIELQTSGVNLDIDSVNCLIRSGVKTISISLSSLDSKINYECNNPNNSRYFVDIEKVSKLIKSSHLNLRFSLNMTKHFEEYSYDRIFSILNDLNVDQVIFRKLYTSGDDELPQNRWIKENRASSEYMDGLKEYIKKNGKIIDKNFLNVPRYSIQNISTILDEDCMSQEIADNYRYLIIKEDCHIYTKWQEPASLLF